MLKDRLINNDTLSQLAVRYGISEKLIAHREAWYVTQQQVNTQSRCLRAGWRDCFTHISSILLLAQKWASPTTYRLLKLLPLEEVKTKRDLTVVYSKDGRWAQVISDDLEILANEVKGGCRVETHQEIGSFDCGL